MAGNSTENQQLTADNFSNVLKYAEFSNAAYFDMDHVKSVCAQYGYKFVYSNANLEEKVKYYIATNHKTKTQLIVARGTTNVNNLLVNMKFMLRRDEDIQIKLHSGFAAAARYVFDDIKPRLKKDYTVYTTGHSLGGAVALILAMHLERHGFKIGNIVTFGQPKVTNPSGAKSFQHLDVTRIATELDVVPIVPPLDTSQIYKFKVDIFWPLGKEIVLLDDGYYSTLEGMDSLLRGIKFLNVKPTEANINAHKMDTYLDLLKKIVKHPRNIPFDQYDRQDSRMAPQQENYI